MPDNSTTIADLRQRVRDFVDEREWQRFHTPKNLCMALSVEVAELVEHFQWLDAEESQARGQDPAFRAAVAEEVADVCCYLLSLVNTLGLDLSTAVVEKMQKNARKYPADIFRGRFEAPSSPPGP